MVEKKRVKSKKQRGNKKNMSKHETRVRKGNIEIGERLKIRKEENGVK